MDKYTRKWGSYIMYRPIAQGDQIQTHQMWDKEYACGGQCGTQRTLAADTKNAYATACQLFSNIQPNIYTIIRL